MPMFEPAMPLDDFVGQGYVPRGGAEMEGGQELLSVIDKMIDEKLESRLK